jgi:hypothetical protein
LLTTIETNRSISETISVAPQPIERMKAMVEINQNLSSSWRWKAHMEKQKIILGITIEPVMDFDVDILAGWIAKINPKFLNLGADSKNHNLPEPTVDKIYMFADKLKEYGIELREKHNLSRLTK